MVYFRRWDEELRYTQVTQAARERAEANASTFSRVHAERADLLAKMYPQMPAGAVLALSRSNLPMSSPAVEQLGVASAKDHLSRHPYGLPSGSRVPAAMLAARPPDPRLREQPEREPVERTITGIDPVLRQEAEKAEKIDPVLRQAAKGKRQEKRIVRHLQNMGVLTSEGVLRRPVRTDPRLAGQRNMSTRQREAHDMFVELAQATMANSDGPVLFVDENGDQGYIYSEDTEDPMTILGAERVPDLGYLSVGRGVEVPEAVKDVGRFIGDIQAPEPLIGPSVAHEAGVVPTDVSSAVRQTAVAWDAPWQELQGLGRTAVKGLRGEGWDFETQSDLGMMMTEGMSIADAGGGWFVDPESEVAQRRREVEAEFGKIGDHNITIGRALANLVPMVDPDDAAFNVMSGVVDLGAAVFTDPVALGFGRVGRARQAKRLFAAAEPTEIQRRAGLHRGVRKMFSEVQGKSFINGPEGRQIVGKIRAERDPYRMWVQFNRQVDPAYAARLADATTDDDVLRVLFDPVQGIGRGIRRVSTVERFGKRPFAVRDMPSTILKDAHDRTEVARQLEAHLFNAHVPQDDIGRIIGKVARTRSEMELNASILDDTAKQLDRALMSRGVHSERLRREITQNYKDATRANSEVWRSSIADQSPTAAGDFVMVNGEPILTRNARLWVEHAPPVVPLWDGRRIRRLTTDEKWKPLMRFIANDEGNLRTWAMIAEGFNQEIFKPLALMRAAWTVRVIAEEQLRMAAAGYDSMFNHPMSYTAWVVGAPPVHKSRLGKKLAGVGRGVSKVTGERGGIDPATGGLWDEVDEFQNAMSVGHGGWAGRPGMVSTSRTTTFYKDSPVEFDKWNDARASQMLKLHADPVARHLARSGDFEETFEWFTRGGGLKFKRDLAKAHPGLIDTDNQARAYLRFNVQERLDKVTGGNPELLEAVRRGKLGEDTLSTGTRLNNQFVKRLEDFAESGPDEIIGEEFVHGRGIRAAAQQWLDRQDAWYDRVFGLLMTDRTNRLSRSPVFRQAYWREIERIMPAMDEDAYQRFLRAAEESNLGSRALRRMRRISQRGDLNFDSADYLGKAFGLTETKDLLYDLTRRGRGMDAMRVIWPFGEAWREVITTWFGTERFGGKVGLVWQKPQLFRRYQQAIQGAREPGFGEVIGAPEYVDPETGELKQAGFFWKHPTTGEEMFTYPFAKWLNEKLLGVPIPLTGRVHGLSMFGEVLPGFGPVAQAPMGWLLESRPGPKAFNEFYQAIETGRIPVLDKTVEDVLLPFGAPGREDPAEAVQLTEYTPPWIREVLQGVTAGRINPEAWANTVMGMMNAKKSTGEYGDSPAEVLRLAEDAERDARWLHVIGTIAKLILPSAPREDWQTLTEDGKWLPTQALAEHARTLQAEDYSTWVERFVELYGEDAIGATVGTSRGFTLNVPVTHEGVHWVQDNPEVKREAPTVYGFFAPEGDEFDFSLWADLGREGERWKLTPKAWGMIIAEMQAEMIYEAQKQKLADPERPTQEEQAWLREWRSHLMGEYYGFRREKGIPDHPTTDEMVFDLYRAVELPAVRDTPAGRALVTYLQQRDKAEAEAKAAGYAGFQEADELVGLRVWLRDWGETLVSETPEFERLWDIVLSREVEDIPEEVGVGS